MRLLSDTNQILIRCESEEELLGKITTAIVAMGRRRDGLGRLCPR